MAILPVFGFDYASKSVNVASQQRVNLYCELKPEKDKTGMALYRTPGLNAFITNAGVNATRGMYQVGNLVYRVRGGTFYEVNNAGVETSRGTLNTTTGNVSMIDNGTQILIVDGTAGYIYTIATLTLSVISSGNFPNGATTCHFQGGFFLVDDPNHTGRFVKSASYDGTTWSATDFGTIASSPCAMVRVYVNSGVVLLMGAAAIEPWTNQGFADFPYAPIQGAALPWGLAAKWSVANVAGLPTFLAQHVQDQGVGQIQAMMMNGFQPQVISTPELDAEFNSYATVLDAIGFSYLFNGHHFYQLNFPSAGKSWLYDYTTSQLAGVNVWSRLSSNGGLHLAQWHVNFLNQNMVSDYTNGNLYKLSSTTYTDNGMALLWKVVSKHVANGTKKIASGPLWVDMEAGVGLATGQGSNPQVMLRYSKDGGKTYSAELWRSLGAQGAYQARLRWNRLGSARDWVFELSGSDPVKIAIINAGLGQ